MHTTDLYEVTDSEESKFSKLVDLFIVASGLSKTDAVQAIVVEKCQALINSSGKVWELKGLIERHTNAWRKSLGFQRLWNIEVTKLKRSKASLEQTLSDVDVGNCLNMSRRGSTSTNRGLSEDSVPTKVNIQMPPVKLANRRAEARRRGAQIKRAVQASATEFITVCARRNRGFHHCFFG